MKLSVLIVAYNHEKYIEQAIRSALMQRTNFDFEIVVGEDCSPDSTASILKRLETEHPDRLRVLYAEKNLGMMANYDRTFAACRGQYVAMLEGDDYWTSPNKLQRQVDFLDEHPECILCFHDVVVFVEGVPQDHDYRPPQRPITGLEDILEDIYINTGSVVLRHNVAPRLPDWARDLIIGDWPLFIHLAEYGKFGYIHEVMAAYRKHAVGAWQRASVPEQIDAVWKMYDRFNEHLKYKYDTQIQVLKRRWAAQIPLVAATIEWMHKAQAARSEIERLQMSRRALKKECQAISQELARLREQLNATSVAEPTRPSA